MKSEQRRGTKRQSVERRRFLGLLGGIGFLGLTPFVAFGRKIPTELSIKEADFYRDHDLAG